MTSNRPLEYWGKLIGDVPSATAILDRFLHHAEVVQITGKSYRLRHQAAKAEESKPANAPAGSERGRSGAKPANAPPGAGADEEESKPANAPPGSGGTPRAES